MVVGRVRYVMSVAVIMAGVMFPEMARD